MQWFYFKKAEQKNGNRVYCSVTEQPQCEGDEKLSKKEYERLLRQGCIENLRVYLKPKRGESTTIYTMLRHVSASGMSRRISAFYVNRKTGELISLDWYIERILGWKRSDKGGIIVGGCGMDMGFHLIYSLSSAIYHDPKNKKGRDSGYTLKHKWI